MGSTKLSIGVLAFFVSLLLSTGVNSQSKEDYVISGTVIDQEGNPVENVRVSAMMTNAPISGRLPSAFTDKDGRFSIEGIRPGHNMVFAEKPEDRYPDLLSLGFGSNVTGADITDDYRHAEVQILLGPKCPRVKGRIMESKTNKVVIDACVKTCLAENPDRCSSIGVDEDGYFNVLVPPEKEFTVSVESPTHTTEQLTEVDSHGLKDNKISLRSGETRAVNFSLRRTEHRSTTH